MTPSAPTGSVRRVVAEREPEAIQQEDVATPAPAAAATTLVAPGLPPAGHLRPLAGSPRPKASPSAERSSTAWSSFLQVVGDAQAIEDALPQFDARSDPGGMLRTRMIQALASLGSGAQAVAKALDDDEERLRIAAVRALDELDATETAPALIERLDQDSDPDVVALAARALARWGIQDAIPSLEALASSEWATRSDEVRDATRDALTHLRASS